MKDSAFFVQNRDTARQVVVYTALASILNSFEDPGLMSANAVRELPDASADNLQSLEQKIYRTIELLKVAREAKTAAERDSARVREQLQARDGELAALREENVALRREREEVRDRVEKLLGQIEALAEE
jgi:FtsZ-binding cell division protein ZapB